MQTRTLEQVRGEPQPDRGVVVAAGEHHRGTGIDQAHHGLREELDRVGRGHRAVVDVAAHHDGVDLLLAHDVHEVVEVGGLRAEEAHLVEGPAQVPVGGVDQSHGPHGRRGVRQSR